MDLHDHLRRVWLPEPGGWSALWTLAEQLHDPVRSRAPAMGGHSGRGTAGRKGRLPPQAAPRADRRIGVDESVVPDPFSPTPSQPAQAVARGTSRGSPTAGRAGGRHLLSDLGTVVPVVPVVRGGGALLRKGIRWPRKFFATPCSTWSPRAGCCPRQRFEGYRCWQIGVRRGGSSLSASDLPICGPPPRWGRVTRRCDPRGPLGGLPHLRLSSGPLTCRGMGSRRDLQRMLMIFRVGIVLRQRRALPRRAPIHDRAEFVPRHG